MDMQRYSCLNIILYVLKRKKRMCWLWQKRLYAWTLTNLRDPEDGCYWNDKQADGSINKTKWTYNTGVMISNGIRLYKITGEQTYLDSAIASSEGAYNYFVRPLNGLALAYPDS